MTKFPDLFDALSEPFLKNEIKLLLKGGKQLEYITARTVMNRLDVTVGPENWWDEYEAKENSVVCRLTIRLPDGQDLTKADAGAYAGMADSGDDDKSGYSDAFKRAAVKFGVGRHLYKDGIPDFGVDQAAPPSTNGHANGHAAPTRESINEQFKPATKKAPPKQDDRSLTEVVADGVEATIEKFREAYPESELAVVNGYMVERHLYKWACGLSLLTAEKGLKASAVLTRLVPLYKPGEKTRTAMRKEIAEYLDKCLVAALKAAADEAATNDLRTAAAADEAAGWKPGRE